ncbi:Homeobox protein KNOX3 [Hordeum vulgare]|nr:Homeobox protein KNOX3 [Hordeum vulgare]
MRVLGTWRLSARGVPLPAPPSAAERRGEIACIRASLSEHAWQEERYAADNLPLWTTYFLRRHADHLASTNGFSTPRGCHNSDDRCQRWGVPGRTLHAVLEHIEGDNEPPLEYPAPSLSRRSTVTAVVATSS